MAYVSPSGKASGVTAKACKQRGTQFCFWILREPPAAPCNNRIGTDQQCAIVACTSHAPPAVVCVQHIAAPTDGHSLELHAEVRSDLVCGGDPTLCFGTTEQCEAAIDSHEVMA